MKKEEMATLELDPLFIKALRLLHSKAKDSTEQLRQLLDDVLVQRQTISSSIVKDRSLFGVIKQEDSNSRLSSLSKKSSPNYGSDNGNSSSRLFLPDEIKKEDKRKSDKVQIKQEPVEFPLEIKRPKTESPQHSLSSTPSPQPIKTELVTPKIEDESDGSDVNANADADEFAMEMGLACVVCKLIDVVQGNNLVECQECHSLYHQECHRPPVTDHDINDPRHVWYCSRCMKNMKKMATKTHKSSKTSSSVSTKEPSPVFRNVKTEPPSLPFKRAEPRVPSSQSSGLSSANKPFGLAGLAANLSGKTTASTASVTSKISSSVKSGNSGSTPISTSKSFNPFPFLSSTRTAPSVTQSKTTNVGVGGLSSLATVASSLSKAGNSTSTSHSKLGSGALSSTIVPTSGKSSSSGGNNGGAKSASSSSLMSADKRLQIMKKRAAAKMQEKRRLSTK